MISSITHFSLDGKTTRCGLTITIYQSGFIGVIDTPHTHVEYKTGRHDSNPLCEECAKLQ